MYDDDDLDRNVESETNVTNGSGQRGHGVVMRERGRCMKSDIKQNLISFIVRTQQRWLTNLFDVLERRQSVSIENIDSQSRNSKLTAHK